jgi:RNA-binding protein NOB1
MAEKPIHTVVLDAGPIIRGEPSVSTLLQKCERIISTPAVVSEIRDANTRSRLQTTLLPFLELLTPRPESIGKLTDFARKTGDLSVLSRPDIQILALAYELECERNGGDWRLRSTPGQKRINAPVPVKAGDLESPQPEPEHEEQTDSDLLAGEPGAERTSDETGEISNTMAGPAMPVSEEPSTSPSSTADAEEDQPIEGGTVQPTEKGEQTAADREQPSTTDPTEIQAQESGEPFELADQLDVTHLSSQGNDVEVSEDSDSGGWITPSNIKKVQAAETAASSGPEQKVMQVATLTTDYAMQNVLLQMNLNLLSPSVERVRHIKTFVLRCHACFLVVKDTSKQFCPRCGKPTLTRVSCTTNSQGEFKMHFKKNMQWNNRGNVYSIPKPVAGSASGKVKGGGGKDGWGASLILAEDQKEYVKALTEQKRVKARDLMDEDYLPGILTGDRSRGGGRPKVGAGRNVNAKKRR